MTRLRSSRRGHLKVNAQVITVTLAVFLPTMGLALGLMWYVPGTAIAHHSSYAFAINDKPVGPVGYQSPAPPNSFYADVGTTNHGSARAWPVNCVWWSLNANNTSVPVQFTVFSVPVSGGYFHQVNSSGNHTFSPDLSIGNMAADGVTVLINYNATVYGMDAPTVYVWFFWNDTSGQWPWQR